MSLAIVTQDYTALPDVLLDTAKAHLRIETGWDDAQIKRMIASAIDELERHSGMTIVRVECDWTPAAAEFESSRARSPLAPVDTFTVDSGGDDISADYAIEHMAIRGAPIDYLVGAFVSGMVVTITSGYADLATMPPGVLDLVLRLTAHLYENREILVPGAQMSAPEWLTPAMSTFWIPRV